MRLVLLPWLALLLAAASPAAERATALLERGEDQAAFELIEAAAPDDPEALDYLAWFYDQGRYVPQDRPRAASLYRQAADRGQAHAQWRLGVMLDTGEGVDEDPDEALVWLRRAVAQDHPEGHASLAVMYANARGVERDYDRAMHHYLRSAELGSSGGFFGIGVLHALGQGVAEDRIEAGAWFLIALMLDDDRANGALDELVLNAAETERAVARGNAILERLGRSERLTYEGGARQT
jgi:uncharacterized protein